MPGPWMGLRAIAASAYRPLGNLNGESYAETFLAPEGAWAGYEPVSDFRQSDLMWYKPIEPEPVKNTVLLGFLYASSYYLYCKQCEVKWFAEPESVPQCWICGRFVRLSQSFKEERRKLREETSA